VIGRLPLPTIRSDPTGLRMCGIAAVFAYGDASPPVDMAVLNAVRDSMSARGPDAFGSWASVRWKSRSRAPASLDPGPHGSRRSAHGHC